MNTSTLRTGAVVAVAVVSGVGSAVWVDSTHPGQKTVVRTETVAAPQNASQNPSTFDVNAIYRRADLGVGVVRTAQGLGTGFVIDDQGHVLTNAHVVLGAGNVTFELPGILGGGAPKTYTAKVLGLDKSTDVAVLQIDAPASQLHPLTLAATGNHPKVGEPVVAIGTPLGEEGTVTSGIVSAVSREIDSLTPGIKIYGAIQTDAAINHGNSGGPLLDANGNVIGITSQILSENNGNVGIGFAIPIGTAKDVADQIISTGKVAHTWLGIEGTDLTPDIARVLNLPVQHGVIVGQVVPNSPAAKAGLQGGSTPVSVDNEQLMAGGDIIVKIGGRDIVTFSDLAETISQHKPGDTVSIELYRHGKPMTVEVTLGTRG
jgi:S1-C subfamily serine protease